MSPFRHWFVLLGIFVVKNNQCGLFCSGFSTTQRRRRRNNSSAGRGGGVDEIEALSRALQIIYRESGTQGVLQKSDGILEQYQAPSLVKAALNASKGKKGVASGILNAFLGAAVCSPEDGGHHAIKLINAYDNLGEEYCLEPDLVALSLAYVATHRQEGYSKIAGTYLQRAEELYPVDGQKTQETIIKETAPEVWSDLKQKHGIQLLQDHEDFMVLSKPSGMVCYHARAASIKQSSNQDETRSKKRKKLSNDISLETCLLDRGIPLSTLNSEGRGMVHRIDRGTSGCIVLAKTNSMHAKLLAQFFLKHRIQKSYQALIASLTKQRPKILPKEGVISLDIDGRPAQSRYHREQCFAHGKVSRILVQTEQGRRHQVRLHCSEGLSAPILLDPLYGGMSIMSQLDAPSQDLCKKLKAKKKFCLHANSLSIPEYGIDVQAPLPDWWQELEQSLEYEYD